MHQTTVVCDQLLEALKVIADGITVSAPALPGDVRSAIQSRFAECWGLIAGLRQSAAGGSAVRAAGTALAAPLPEMQHVVQAHESAFAAHRLTHRLHAAPNLPHVGFAPEALRFVWGEILAHAIRLAAARSCLVMRLREVALRQGIGVECSVTVRSPAFTEQDRYRLFEELAGCDDGSPRAFAYCRQLIDAAYGQVWVEMPERGRVAFVLVVPCVTPAEPFDLARWKCDIAVADYEACKGAMGTRKAAQMLGRLADITRGALRAPLDVVAAFEGRGLVSAIVHAPAAARETILARLRATHRTAFAAEEGSPPRLEYHVIDLP
ncbi:MAG: sensor histidine kinase [Deltaproteobacteria bacterium]|nr:sensor histidine kinase [Deltaproteobacteria bacterium]